VIATQRNIQIRGRCGILADQNPTQQGGEKPQHTYGTVHLVHKLIPPEISAATGSSSIAKVAKDRMIAAQWFTQ
jgi:hypothetical protein